MKKDIKQVIKDVKMDYPKLTFRLSVFGFIASIAFYFGVLRSLRPTEDKIRIEQLTQENERLENQVDLLIEKSQKSDRMNKPISNNDSISHDQNLNGKNTNQYELNKQIEAFIIDKDDSKSSYSQSELDFISQYSGNGGLAKKGATGRGLLDEFYTPDYICELLWQLARKHGYSKGSVLEPSCGTGRLIKYANSPKDVVAFEVNQISARIAELTNTTDQGKPTIHTNYFETAFLDPPRYRTRMNGYNTWLKQAPFSLVIGNPPFGKFKSYYSSYFKKPKVLQVEHFFMYYGLKLLKKNGLMIYVTGSNFLSNGNTYDPIRKELEKICTLEEAFRLPPVFRFSQIPTDILVFRKK